MALNPGEEFNIKATPSQELLRKLAYLARQDNDSVLTGGMRAGQRVGGADQKSARADRFFETLQFIQRQEQIRLLNERLNELDGASLEALRTADERLEEIRRTANRTRDGRLAFEDRDGKIRDENGKEIGREQIDQAQWKSEAPRYEIFREAMDQHREAREYREKVLEQKARLDGELSDKDLDDLEKQITELEAARPATEQQAAAPRTTSAAKTYDADAASNESATLRDPFAGAATGGTVPVKEQPMPMPAAAPAIVPK